MSPVAGPSPLRADELDAVVRTMVDTGASYAGMSDEAALRAWCRAALRRKPGRRGVVVVVARDDEVGPEGIAGYLVIYVGPSGYWPLFLARNPKLALRSVRNRLLPGRGGTARSEEPSRVEPVVDPTDPTAPPAPPHRATSRRYSSFAYIAVVPEARGRGLAEELYRAGFGLMAEEGVEWATGSTAWSNRSSQKATQRAGWELVATAERVEVYRDLRGYSDGRVERSSP